MRNYLMASMLLVFGLSVAGGASQIAPGGVLARVDTWCTPPGPPARDRRDRTDVGCEGHPGRSASRARHPERAGRAWAGQLPGDHRPRSRAADSAEPRPFGIDGLKEPRLVTWAVKGTSLDSLARDAVRDGVKLGEVIAGSRRRADGVLLTWRYTDPRTVVADGVVPFVIDWGATPHPSSTATAGASLVGLRAEHPDPQAVQDALKRLGLELPVQRGPRAALIATVNSPRGRVELR